MRKLGTKYMYTVYIPLRIIPCILPSVYMQVLSVALNSPLFAVATNNKSCSDNNY